MQCFALHLPNTRLLRPPMQQHALARTRRREVLTHLPPFNVIERNFWSGAFGPAVRGLTSPRASPGDQSALGATASGCRLY